MLEFSHTKAEFAAYNAIDSIFILALAMWYGTMVCLSIAVVIAQDLVKVFLVVSFLVGALPLLYLVVSFLHWICSRKGVGQKLVGSINIQIGRMYRRARGTSLEESLPDRLINPCLYHDDVCHNMTSRTEKFSGQTYSKINNTTTM